MIMKEVTFENFIWPKNIQSSKFKRERFPNLAWKWKYLVCSGTFELQVVTLPTKGCNPIKTVQDIYFWKHHSAKRKSSRIRSLNWLNFW